MRTTYTNTHAQAEPAVEAAGLEKSYGTVRVLDGVDIRMPQGSVLAMICVRPVHTHGANFYLIGGRKLDAVLQSLAPPEGLRVSLYSAPEQGQAAIIKNGH